MVEALIYCVQIRTKLFHIYSFYILLILCHLILLTDGVITFPAISVFNNYLVTTRSSNSFGIGEGRCKRIGGGATVASIADRDTRNYVLSALTRVEGWYSSEWLDREIFVYGSTDVAHNGLLDNPRSQLLDNTSGNSLMDS